MARRSSRSFAVLLAIVLSAAALGPAFLHHLSAAPAPAVPSGGSLVSSIRSDPNTFNRYVSARAAVENITFLLHARLVRVNRATMEVEPMLAESWSRSKDNLTFTLKLRRGVKWSDGAPFTSADVVFSFKAIYYKNKDNRRDSPLGDSLQVGGRELQVAAVDDNTVTVRFAAPFSPGVRVLDNLPIFPKHVLEASLNESTFASAWGTGTPPEKIVGLGPFVLKEYVPGQRLVFDRNPHYWRRDAAGKRLPYLDRITLEIVPDQNAELLRLQGGQLDCTRSELRPEDYATLKQAAAAGKVRLVDLGAGLNSDALWFNLRPNAKIAEAKRAWLQNVELRRAINEAVDRTRFGNTVFFGAAVPAFGPVSPANRAWHDAQLPKPKFDRASAAKRLAAIGLRTKNAEGVLLDQAGAPAQFTLLTQKGNTALERGAATLRDELRAIGLVVDVVPLQVGALAQRVMIDGDFEAVYYRMEFTDTDPATTMDFWRSSGDSHPWNPGQKQPATEWERRIDDLMVRQAATFDVAERKRLFTEVQRVFADQVPMLYFATPRVFVATSARMANVTAVPLAPVVLWTPETVAVQGKAGTN